MIINLRIKYVGQVNDLRNPEKPKIGYMGFYAFQHRGDNHVYDSGFLFENEPKKKYELYSVIPLEDLDIKHSDDGKWIKSVSFK